MNIIEALQDSSTFGALEAFRDLSTWRPWLTNLRSVYGLPMDDEDLVRFRKHTGRDTPRPGGYPEAVNIVGCQSGKSQIAAAVGGYEAAQAAMAGQRGVYVPLIAQDLRGAQRTLLGYVKEAFSQSELLRREVVRQTAESIELNGNVSLPVYPCRPASLRGIRARCVVIDELAFFITTDGRPTDVEMLRVARTRLATTGGKLIILSSPYGQSGALWELCRRHWAKDTSTLIWRASAPEMNPTLPADYLARMEAEDPEAYRSEVLGEFRAGISTLLDFDAIMACVAKGVRERAYEPGEDYVSFNDPASGSGKDSWGFGIGHKDGERAVLDVLRAWKPPFNPSGVISEVSDLLRRYGLSATSGDRYAPGFVAEGFRACGIEYKPSDLDRSALYLELLPIVNAGRAVLLDDPELLRELRGLERRRGSSGRDRVDHRAGSHDDKANACAGTLVFALKPRFTSGSIRIGGIYPPAPGWSSVPEGDPLLWWSEGHQFNPS